MVRTDEVGDDLEQVEGVQRKFDDFQKVKYLFEYIYSEMIL